MDKGGGGVFFGVAPLPQPLFFLSQGVAAVVVTDAAGIMQRSMGDVRARERETDGLKSGSRLEDQQTPPLPPRLSQPDACKQIPLAVAPLVTLTRAMLRELDGQARRGKKRGRAEKRRGGIRFCSTRLIFFLSLRTSTCCACAAPAWSWRWCLAPTL